MREELSAEKINAIAQKASRLAVERAEALGIPYTIQKGCRIVEIHPDGSEKIVGTLKKAFVKPTAYRYRVV